MKRRPTNPTPERRIADVLRWAEQQGFKNVAGELRQALADMNARTNAQ